MRHFDITRWADYVRGLGDPGEATVMRRHLDDGCERCAATTSTLAQLAETAAVDATNAVPPGALRSVKALFSVQQPEARASRHEPTLRQVFDSALAPALAASRASVADSRQLLFESDDYTLELSVDPVPDTRNAVVRGQLLEAPGKPRSHTPVFLVSRGQVLARAISERQGTFELTGRFDAPCELWVIPDDEHRIKLPLAPEN